jgi:arylsulfatase A-like enzyme
MSVKSSVAAEPAADAPQLAPLQVGPGRVLLIAAWIGLIAGIGDVVLLVLRKRWIDRDFLHAGADFPWIIPIGVTVLVLVPAILVALIAKIRGSTRFEFAVAPLFFVGFLDLFTRLPIELYAAMIISGGIAIQTVRVIGRRTKGFLRLVTWTVPLLVGMLLTTMLLMTGARAWSEHRQASTLPPARTGAPNVLLIVWDTVRAANTSLHGYSRATTPNLAKLAAQGVRFDAAFSTSSWTLPSHASLFTGRWPHELGVGWKTPMRDDVQTLAGYLASHGYDTAGFVANLENCSRETGLARGFVHYEDFPFSLVDAIIRYTALGRRLDLLHWPHAIDSLVETKIGRWYDLIPRSKEHLKNGEAIDSAFLKWFNKRPETARPFFAFLNYNDAHSPYEVPDQSIPGFGRRPRSSAERQKLVNFSGLDKTRLTVEDIDMFMDCYDDCIFYLDRRLGLLLDELDRRGVLKNTLVIVTADHGEHLGDHGLFFHGNSLYRETVQVPLVIVGNQGIPVGRTVAETVGLNDIPATVVDLLGLGQERPFLGRSVARYWQPITPGVPIVSNPLLMETTRPVFLANDGREPAAKGPMKAVIAAGMHYIQMADGSEELFKLSSDVEEKANLANNPDMFPVLVELRNLLGLMLHKRTRQ